MKFSIIGTGFIMPRHAEAIHTVGGKIREVVNTTHGTDAWQKMTQNTDADCIVILTPNDLHFPMAMAAVEAGKIVLCEKPLSFQSEEVRTLALKPNIFTVLQLKYHPHIKKLRAEMRSGERYEVEMDIAVWRDPAYYQGWKGDPKRSGGILFNIGIHYFDLLIHLFGPPTEINGVHYAPKTASGSFRGANYTCLWRVSIDEPRETQRRVFKINGVPYNFSSQDNLSHENLHREVYRDLLEGKGVTAEDSLPAILLIEEIHAKAGVRIS